MTIKLKDKTIMQITPPVEQKIFSGTGSVGKVITFSIAETMTLDEADAILTQDNISSFGLISDDTTSSKTITGYEKVAMLVARYNNDTSAIIEIQLSKGLN